MTFQMTACEKFNTATRFAASAESVDAALKLIGGLWAYSPSLNVTVNNTNTGVVHTFKSQATTGRIRAILSH